MTKNTRRFLFDGYTYNQEQQFKKHRHDLEQLQNKSNQQDPVRVPQYERD